MFNIDFQKERKEVRRTYEKFFVERLKIFLSSERWMSEERQKQFKVLCDCIESNKEFIAKSLVSDYHLDYFGQISEFGFATEILSDPIFIIMLSGQSLTNRIVEACEKGELYDALKYRIRQCIWIYAGYIDQKYDTYY